MDACYEGFSGSFLVRYIDSRGAVSPVTPCFSQKVINHSPDGFAWGYEGSGPAQLALAILLRHVGREKAVELHQRFKAEVIAGFPMEEGWQLTEDQILAWLGAHGVIGVRCAEALAAPMLPSVTVFPDPLVAAAVELMAVATLRGDNSVPPPDEDPKLWSARMADAWRALEEVLDLVAPRAVAQEVAVGWECQKGVQS